MTDPLRSTPRRSAYVPLTEEEVEAWRKKIKAKIFNDFCGEPNEAHGEELQARFGTLCDMAINSLLFSKEIDRLRSNTASETKERDALLDDVLWGPSRPCLAVNGGCPLTPKCRALPPTRCFKAPVEVKEYVVAIEREVDALRENMRSSPMPRDMDAAPKDGTPVLGWCPSYYQGKGAWVVILWLGEKGLREAGWMDNRAFLTKPTLWMPLPEVPRG